MHGPTASQTGAQQRALPLLHLIELSVYWFGISIIWGGLDGAIIPHRLAQAYPDDFGLRFAIISAAAVVMAIVVQPTVGIISDYTATRWGRRKPYIVVGALLDVVFIIGVASSQEFLVLLVFMVLLQFSSNFAQGPFQGYVPDLVPARQVGLASGLMGLMLVLGRIAGVGVGTLGIFTGNLWVATVALGVIEVATMVVLVRSVHEGSAAPPRPGTWWQVARSAWGADILRERNVLWLLLVRLMFLGAIASTSLGLSYFARSHGLDSDTEAPGFLFAGTLIVGVMTALAAVPGGRLSDRFGRKPMIYLACVVAAIGMVGVAVAPTPELAIAAYVPFGLGAGIFLSVDWALMADVIPKETTGRYMGILNAGTAAAGPVYLLVAGLTLDAFSRVELGLGPRSAMVVAAAFLLLAGLALTRVDPRRRELEPQLVAAAA